MMLATLPSYILFYIHTPIKVEGGTKGGVLYYNYFFIPPPSSYHTWANSSFPYLEVKYL